MRTDFKAMAWETGLERKVLSYKAAFLVLILYLVDVQYTPPYKC